MTNKIKISVIVVNYNGAKFLEPCINSIKKNIKKFDSEIIVIDNNSSDESDRYLSNRTDIVYIRSKYNLGFTGGNNEAVKLASGELLLLINNDTEIQTLLDPFIDAFLSDDDIGVAGPKLFYGDGRVQHSMGFEHTPFRMAFSWMGLEKSKNAPSIFKRLNTNNLDYIEKKNDVDWVSGACFLTKKSIWQTLGGLDNDLFMYCEDVDFCDRVKKLGFKVSFIPCSEVLHYEGSGKIWIGHLALLRTLRSYLIILSKKYGIINGLTVRVLLILIFFSRAILFSLMSFSGEKRKLQAHGFKRACLYLCENFFKRKSFKHI